MPAEIIADAQMESTTRRKCLCRLRISGRLLASRRNTRSQHVEAAAPVTARTGLHRDVVLRLSWHIKANLPTSVQPVTWLPEASSVTG